MGANYRHTWRCHAQRHRDTRHRDLHIGGVCDDLCHPGGNTRSCKHDDRWLGNWAYRGTIIHQWDLGWDLGWGLG